MRPESDRRIVGFLAAADLDSSQIADVAGIPRSTVRDWLLRPVPAARRRAGFDPRSLPEAVYSYLLGFYLGDGTISLHRGGVYRLRIVTDTRYPGVIAECTAAIEAVMPQNRVHVQRLPSNAVEISAYSKAWPLAFPQHGPGRKHLRKIELVPWQAAIVQRCPREFLRGLIHSDGCRVLNRVNGTDYPRYFSTKFPTTSAASSTTPATALASAIPGASRRPFPSPAARVWRCSTRS